MKNMLLRVARQQHQWSQQCLADFAGVSLSTVERAERGESIRIDNLERLCDCLRQSPEQLGLVKQYTEKLFIPTSQLNLISPLADDLLATYARGILACQNLYYNGNPGEVEAILPLYIHQTTLLAQQPGPLQHQAAILASEALQLACELATDREDFGAARQAGQQALFYAQLADDYNRQVAALISLGNLGFHLSTAQPSFLRSHSKEALKVYQHAVALLDNKDHQVTALLKGRTFAGIAEVYAMRGQTQEALQSMGRAYEYFPAKPEDDPAYPYLRASRYALYVFGDAQSRLFLSQPQEAEEALDNMKKETNDPEKEPITLLDLLYYRAEIEIQKRDLEKSSTILTEAATLAKSLGSRLYFNKLAVSYQKLEVQWPEDPRVIALEDAFQPW